jgi:hypothetical protein
MSTFGRPQTAVPKTFRQTRTAQKAAAAVTEPDILSSTPNTRLSSPPMPNPNTSQPEASSSSMAQTPGARPSSSSQLSSIRPSHEARLSESNEATAALQTLSQVLAHLADSQDAQSAQLRADSRQHRANSQHMLSLLSGLAGPPAEPNAQHPPQPYQPLQGHNFAVLPHDPSALDQPNQQGHLFVPPPTGNTGAGASLSFLFPEIEEGMLLAITRHTIKPGHLFKLDTRIKEKPSAKILDFKNSTLIHCEQEPCIKEYSWFVSLYLSSILKYSKLPSPLLETSQQFVRLWSHATTTSVTFMTSTPVMTGPPFSTTILRST